MLWRKSWTFGTPVESALGIYESGVTSDDAFDDVPDLLTGTLPAAAAPLVPIALADFAPADDDAVGVLERDDGTREVFFKPVPNDGTRSSWAPGASAIQISVMAPRSGNYQLSLTQRRGSEEFSDEAGSACHSSGMQSGQTDSFFICSSDPRSSATNPDPGTPDTSSCKAYHYSHFSSQTFSLSGGVNSLWLASREVCALASKITITAG